MKTSLIVRSPCVFRGFTRLLFVPDKSIRRFTASALPGLSPIACDVSEGCRRPVLTQSNFNRDVFSEVYDTMFTFCT